MRVDRVRVYGNAGGMATLLAMIVRSNVAEHPERAAFLSGPSALVAVHATDTGETVALEFRDEQLRIYADGSTSADLEVTGDIDSLLRVLAAPIVPNPLRASARTVIGRVLSGRVRTRGLVRRVAIARRVRGLLTTAP